MKARGEAKGKRTVRRRGASVRARRFERQLRATAHHEAGHAVMAELLGVPYKSVSIVPTASEAGRVILADRPWPQDPDPFDPRVRGRVENRVMVHMAGFIAESLYTGRCSHVHAFSDQAATWELVGVVAFNEREQALHLEALYARAAFLMRRGPMRRSVRALARALVDRGTLQRHDVADLIAAAWKADARRRRQRKRERRAA